MSASTGTGIIGREKMTKTTIATTGESDIVRGESEMRKREEIAKIDLTERTGPSVMRTAAEAKIVTQEGTVHVLLPPMRNEAEESECLIERIHGRVTAVHERNVTASVAGIALKAAVSHIDGADVGSRFSLGE